MIINTQPSGGGVYITDITPTSTGTVSNKVYEDGEVLKTCDTDTLEVTVSVLAISGPTHLIPRVVVNGVSVSNFTLNAQMRYTGSCNITLTDAAILRVIAEHYDGGSSEVIMTKAAGPEILAFNFTGGYPGSQTELKSGDTFNIMFTTDVPSDYVEVSDYEACSSKSQSLSGSGPYTISTTITSRGSGTISNQRCRIRCRGTNGIWGNWILSDVFGSGDGSAYVQLNNDAPVISTLSQASITYPATQQALKDSETAVIANTITVNSGSFTVAYTSPNSELSIANSTTYEASKTVTRIAGNYNITTNNFTINATKTSNNKTATARSVVVYIAHTTHTAAITLPTSRLRSSPSGLSHVITITTSQILLEAPTLNALGSGEGTWQGSGFSGSNTVWTRSMLVVDTDTKGTFTFTGLVSKNLAGKELTTITSGANYTLGGFSSRTVTFAAWPNREASLGVQVSNTAKLTCVNNSKGEGYTITFKTSTADEVDKFTITEPTTVYNAAGNLVYNCDLANAIANGSGTATFTIEEIV